MLKKSVVLCSETHVFWLYVKTVLTGKNTEVHNEILFCITLIFRLETQKARLISIISDVPRTHTQTHRCVRNGKFQNCVPRDLLLPWSNTASSYIAMETQKRWLAVGFQWSGSRAPESSVCVCEYVCTESHTDYDSHVNRDQQVGTESRSPSSCMSGKQEVRGLNSCPYLMYANCNLTVFLICSPSQTTVLWDYKSRIGVVKSVNA